MSFVIAIDKRLALERTVLFAGLEKGALSALAARAVIKHLNRDEVLFVAGEEARGLYVIVDGAVRAFRTSPDGREQIIHVENAPATFAEVPVFDDQVYPSTVAAETESTLLFIGKGDIKQLCLEHPQIALAAAKLMAGRLRRCAELVEALSLRDVGQRLARFLLAEARTRGKATPIGLSVELNHTNQQIAARIGTVREVVSRSLARLLQKGLIQMDGRLLIVTDELGLALLAGAA